MLGRAEPRFSQRLEAGDGRRARPRVTDRIRTGPASLASSRAEPLTLRSHGAFPRCRPGQPYEHVEPPSGADPDHPQYEGGAATVRGGMASGASGAGVEPTGAWFRAMLGYRQQRADSGNRTRVVKLEA
jgi:hypothetical protein